VHSIMVVKEKKMAEKFLFKGIFNYYGETNTLYTHAQSRAQAFNFFCRQLSEKYEHSYMAIYSYFAKTDRYKIIEEGEKKMKVEIKLDQFVDEIKPLIEKEIAVAIDRLAAKRITGVGAPRGGEKWSKEEDASLRTDFCEFISNRAFLTGRSFASITARVKKIFDDGILY